MASGPEHYQDAERLLWEAQGATTVESAMRLAARAQVHATLALAATNIVGVLQDESVPRADREFWGQLTTQEAADEEEARRQEGMDATYEHDPDLGKDLDYDDEPDEGPF
jgi:hypothetical protein